jgi:hypothetical protein
MEFGEALARLSRVQKTPKGKRKAVNPEPHKTAQGRVKNAKSG